MELTIRRRTVHRALGILAGLFAMAGLVSEISDHILEHHRLLGFVDLFDMTAEMNAPTWYTTALLLSAALLLAIIGGAKWQAHDPFRRHWVGLALIFAYLSADEAAFLHEMTIRPLRYYWDTSGIFYFPWTIPFGIAIVFVALLYRRFLLGLEPKHRTGFLLAGAVYVGGALGTEFPIGAWFEIHGDDFFYGLMNVGQETLEITGVSIFIAVLLRYLSSDEQDVRLSVR